MIGDDPAYDYMVHDYLCRFLDLDATYHFEHQASVLPPDIFEYDGDDPNVLEPESILRMPHADMANIPDYVPPSN